MSQAKLISNQLPFKVSKYHQNSKRFVDLCLYHMLTSSLKYLTITSPYMLLHKVIFSLLNASFTTSNALSHMDYQFLNSTFTNRIFYLDWAFDFVDRCSISSWDPHYSLGQLKSNLTLLALLVRRNIELFQLLLQILFSFVACYTISRFLMLHLFLSCLITNQLLLLLIILSFMCVLNISKLTITFIRNEIFIFKVNSKDQIVDIFKKSLPTPCDQFFHDKLIVQEIFPDSH